MDELIKFAEEVIKGFPSEYFSTPWHASLNDVSFEIEHPDGYIFRGSFKADNLKIITFGLGTTRIFPYADPDFPNNFYRFMISKQFV